MALLGFEGALERELEEHRRIYGELKARGAEEGRRVRYKPSPGQAPHLQYKPPEPPRCSGMQ